MNQKIKVDETRKTEISNLRKTPFNQFQEDILNLGPIKKWRGLALLVYVYFEFSIYKLFSKLVLLSLGNT